MEKKSLKKLIIIIYAIIIIYTLEILTYLFLVPEQQKLLVDIENSRVGLAKELGIKIDKRTELKAFLDEKKNYPKLEPSFYFNRQYENFSTFKNAIENNLHIPFRGPINNLTLSCNEELSYSIIQNDKFGFKNRNKIYEKNISIAVLGDSYAEGLCQNNENDVAGHLIKSGVNTVNLGVTGSGPLLSLAILKEYVNFFNPQMVVYLYFEGNDLNDLKWEIEQEYLKNYLKKGYIKDYVNNQENISTFLENIKLEQYEIIKQLSKDDLITIDNKEKNKKYEIFKDLRELTNLRTILKGLINYNDTSNSIEILFSVIDKMNYELLNQNKDFIFVYVPSWERYFTNNSKNIYLNNKDKIIKFLKKTKTKYIDLDEYFINDPNLNENFPLGFVGHYSSKGYEKIANLINEEFKN